MADDFRYDVFLSHSAKDRAVVLSIAERLKADGLRVWLDEWEIGIGDSIPAKIEDGIEQSRVLVLCMSVHAFGSDWAQLETGTFRFRDPLNKTRRFVPLKLDDTAPRGSLASFLHISWLAADREREYPRLLHACRSASADNHSSAPVEPVFPLQPPGAQYDARWYVPRNSAESAAHAFLGVAGKPIVVWAPESFGKTWFLEHALGARTTLGRVVRVTLRTFASRELSTFDAFLHRMARDIASQLKVSREQVEQVWSDDLEAENGKFENFLAGCLAGDAHPLLLAIDSADEIVGRSYSDDFFKLMRGFAETTRSPWPRLRLLIAVSTPPLRLTRDLASSLFVGLSTPIELGPLGNDQVASLAALHRLAWRPDDIADVMGFCGGHPYLVRTVMHEAALHGRDLASMVTSPLEIDALAQYMRRIRRHLQENPSAQTALRAVATEGARDLDAEKCEPLRRAGLVVRHADGSFHLRGSLYRHLLS